MPAEFVLALIAGVVSVLSPCVLPILPIIIAGARAEHRFAPVALASGLAVSLALLSGVLAAVGVAFGIYVYHARWVAAGMLVLVGLVLILPAAQRAVGSAVSPFGTYWNSVASRLAGRGLIGQFVLGLLLGGVWTPCVGPTLGAASVLAAQGEDLPFALTVMILFGFGAALPMLFLAAGVRGIADKMERFRRLGQHAKLLTGLAFLFVGGLVLSGVDKQIEAALLTTYPQWLTDITTRF